GHAVSCAGGVRARRERGRRGPPGGNRGGDRRRASSLADACRGSLDRRGRPRSLRRRAGRKLPQGVSLRPGSGARDRENPGREPGTGGGIGERMTPERAAEPAGICVHLPFCRSRCAYCAFVVTTDVSSRAEYFSALAREIEVLRSEAEGDRFDSIYLGGGTPSFVPTEEISRLLDRLQRSFRIDPSPEVTIEANPDDVLPGSPESWAALGVTRISLGVQSLNDSELAAAGRRHDAGGARKAIESLVRSGFSLSADLILGLPGQTAQSFASTVDELCRFG